MKTLGERLERIKADFSSKAPAEALAIIDLGLQRIPDSEALLLDREELTARASVRP